MSGTKALDADPSLVQCRNAEGVNIAEYICKYNPDMGNCASFEFLKFIIKKHGAETTPVCLEYAMYAEDLFPTQPTCT